MAKKTTTAATSDVTAATPGVDEDPRWTVMIFMGATTVLGGEPLIDAANADLEEIKAIGGGGRSDLNIYVQLNRDDGEEPYRYHFGHDQYGKPNDYAKPVPADQRDYQNGRALSQFIEHGLDHSNHRRQDHTMLVLWGHAYDFAFGRSLTPGGAIAALDFIAISDVLSRLQEDAQKRFVALDPKAARKKTPPTLDIIGFDACDISTVELAYQLRKFAKFLLSSQIGIPIPGWPYHRILDRLQNPYGDVMSPPELGAYTVRRFCDTYDATSPVTLSMINLALADELFDRAEAMAVELAIAIENPDARERILEWFYQSQTEPGKPFVDVADLCLNLLGESDYPMLVHHARELGDLVAGHHGVVAGKSKTYEGWRLVAEHGRNSGDLVRLNGLSLFAPHVALPNEPDVVRNRYGAFDFAQKTRWGASVHKLAGLS